MNSLPFNIWQHIVCDYLDCDEQINLGDVIYGIEITNLYEASDVIDEEIIDVMTDDELKKYNLLKRLYLGPHVTDEGLKELNLFTLSLGANGIVTDNGIKHMTNLQELRLECNGNMTNNGLENLNLQSLELGDNKNITYDGIKHMNLHNLDLGWNENFTDDDEQKLTENGCEIWVSRF